MAEISIIVPVYKVEAYLPDCVRSLQNQTFRDIEILLVDDGSPDNCPQLCDAFAAEDSRIRVIHQENAGLSAARNAGIDIASGNYICFIDSDDLVEPEYCQVLFDLLNGTEYDFSFCGTLRFPDGTVPAPVKPNETPFVVSNTAFLKMQLDKQTEFGVWNKLYRREMFAKLRFADGMLNEDVIFSADLFLHLNNCVIGTRNQLHCYRRRAGSIVALQLQKGSPDQVYAGEYLLNAVKTKAPELYTQTLHYSVSFPWSFVDPIYVHCIFRENRAFLDVLQKFLREYLSEYQEKQIFPEIQLRRMALFANSRFLYGFNAYMRLLRVYIFRLLGKDAYADGHGI